MKVLVSGGSGFIAAHCVEALLQAGHDVVFTVRSDDKGQQMLKSQPEVPSSKLSYVIVKDIAHEDAFDEAVKSNPPFEAVLHTASPFHLNPTDAKKDFLDPAIIGTRGMLKSVKTSAPSVKRVVITSSFAAIVNPVTPPNVYSEESWNPITYDDAIQNPQFAYAASKAIAERVAWEFVEKEKPGFDLVTINPPVVLGPVVPYLTTLAGINTSNIVMAEMVQGKMRDGLAPTRFFQWVDVRDVALAHVRAIEATAAGGKRFLVMAGLQCNADIATIIKNKFPELADKLPIDFNGDIPKDIPGYDNSRSRGILGLEFRALEETVVDTVKSILAVKV